MANMWMRRSFKCAAESTFRAFVIANAATTHVELHYFCIRPSKFEKKKKSIIIIKP